MVTSWVLAQLVPYTATPSNQLSWLTDPFFSLLGWLFNPATLISAGFKMFGVLTGVISKVIPPGPVHDIFVNMSVLSRAIPITAGWGVVTYLCSPIINPVILNTVVAVRIQMWLLATVARMAIWVWNLKFAAQ